MIGLKTNIATDLVPRSVMERGVLQEGALEEECEMGTAASFRRSPQHAFGGAVSV